MKTLTTTVARILFGVPFLVLGSLHFAFADQMKMALPAFLPGGVLWMYVTGIGLVAAAISVFSQKFINYAMIGLSIFLMATIAIIHIPNLGNPDPIMMQMAMSGMFKDIGLLGGALVFLGLYSTKNALSTE